MAADASIFQQYLQPVKSVQDYAAANDAREQNALTLASSRLKGQADQQEFQDAQAYRQAGIDSAGDQNALVKALMSKGLVKQAQAVQTAGLANSKTIADTGLANAHAKNFGATTAETDFKTRIAKSDQAIKDISSFGHPDEAKANLQAHIASGDIDPVKGQAMMQSIPQDPAQFPTWQLGMLRNIMSAKDQMALQVPDANSVLSSSTSRLNNADTNATSVSNNTNTVNATLSGQASTAATAAAGRAQADRHFNATQTAGNQAVTYQTDGNGNLVALPSKITPGSGVSAMPVLGADGKPMQGSGNKPSVDYLKQAEAYQNMDNALADYKQKLSTFSKIDMINPAKRADMGTSYSNAMLQAKEIYKLGVLNGGDERILKSIINSPIDFTSALIPTDSLMKQATDLQAIIKRGNENLAKVNKQTPLAMPSGQPSAPGKVVDFGSLK